MSDICHKTLSRQRSFWTGDLLDEERLVQIMQKSDHETLETMLQLGTDALGRIHGHIDSLHSKNGNLMGLSLGVVSLIIAFSIEFAWLDRSELELPLLLFSVCIVVSVVASSLVFRPKSYGEVGAFDDRYIYHNLGKDKRELLMDQIITVKEAIDDCNSQYKNDVTLFWIAFSLFSISLVVLTFGLV